jgi:Na+-transporting NADH:ubiquinone oxidoreductase subunit NqrB
MTSAHQHTRPRLDPRLYQISVLAGLLSYGIARLHFEIRPAQAVVILGGVLATQYVCTRAWKLKAFDPKSALISGLSLCLLLRTNHLAVAGVAAFLAVASKFVLRVNGKHLFNPTNFAIVALLLTTDLAWVSPGQWGSIAYFGFLTACLGGLVVNRASRSDVTFAFLASYLAILFGYSLWLGQPVTIPLHRLQNGAFLIFSFFMISDPRTTPDSRAGRILFAFLVAAGAALVQFGLYRTNGLLWSLALFSLAVPWIDRVLPGPRYQWQPTSSSPGEHEKGAFHETNARERDAVRGRGALVAGRP